MCRCFVRVRVCGEGGGKRVKLIQNCQTINGVHKWINRMNEEIEMSKSKRYVSEQNVVHCGVCFVVVHTYAVTSIWNGILQLYKVIWFMFWCEVCQKIQFTYQHVDKCTHFFYTKITFHKSTNYIHHTGMTTHINQCSARNHLISELRLKKANKNKTTTHHIVGKTRNKSHLLYNDDIAVCAFMNERLPMLCMRGSY